MTKQRRGSACLENVMKILGFFTGAALALSLTTANAATFNFANIAGGDTAGDALVSKFSLVLTSFNASEVLIQIKSAANAGATYFISDIYLDDEPSAVLGGEVGAFSATNSIGLVRFVDGKANQNFPQGNSIGFGTTASYLEDKKEQGEAAHAPAVQQGETVGFLFDATYNNVFAALTSGALRFGIHVQGIGEGSDSFVTTRPVPTIPLPAGGMLLVGAISVLGALRRRWSVTL